MKGLELAKKYYEEIGKPAILRDVPEAASKIAAGLVGHGSECFGFDDVLSRDHDFGPSFCIWLADEDYAQYGEALQKCYASLPPEFAGFPARQMTEQGGGRVGVLRISDFYEGLIGKGEAPKQENEWYMLPESGLAAAVNGVVFEDNTGKFSGIREELLAYYPESVRLRRMAQAAALAAQAGQYNYSRLMKRGEWTAAAMAEKLFLEQAMQLVYLLNRRYAPFYKWMHRGMKEFVILSELYDLFEQLVLLPVQKEAWESGKENYRYGLNLADAKVVCIETICAGIVKELHRQGLSDVQDNYLEAHAGAILCAADECRSRAVRE